MIAEREQVIGGIITVLGLVAIGVGVGISNTGNNSSPLSSSSNGPDQPDSNDPSSFVVDKRLHRSLYGLAYTPEGSLLPDCGNSLGEVIKDIQVGVFRSPNYNYIHRAAAHVPIDDPCPSVRC